MNQLNLQEKRELLDALNYEIRTCEKCSLSATRKYALTGEGNIGASILFVALSPGAKEDIGNKMFIGPSGQVFNRLLQTAGIERQSVYMTNLVKCLLPNNRKPTWNEIEACSSFLGNEISIIQPQIIVPLGYYATRSILTKYHADPSREEMSFKNVNGKLLVLDGMKIFPLTHPSALLYNPSFEPSTIEKYSKLNSYL
ncbi:uracil-DNA glycosylase [Labilibaculum antarcticum]|uniref:Type-4 uracil-DNA glycosylase n=1 Tax=Labilibaculum antarcticum TaxID=1717717 RepID=A0A1Y1CM77_9BACT|nr:uracil-DNA glycosylase [Labilibaculum antarcticum]BAX81455.1 uracil-DNA glycosylase [Labilibaculum antarcticum]